MSDNNIKLKAGQSVAEAAKAVEPIETIEAVEPIETENVSDEELKQAAAEFLKKAGKAPTNNGGAEKVLELYQKISASGLPYSEKEPLLKKLLSEWKKIVEDISETALNAQPELTVGYILSQIEKIQQDNEHVLKALNSLENIVINDGSGDIANQARGAAIGEIVESREATNQRLIAFYEKLYDDIKPEPVDFNHFSLEQIVDAIERCDEGVMSGETAAALKSTLIDRLKFITLKA